MSQILADESLAPVTASHRPGIEPCRGQMVTDDLMRRYENRRGAMVTDKADREGVESRKNRFGMGRWYQDASRQQYH
ncbi:hypothetical protein [Nitrosomonas sp.]|uniref:hypothetical protein n=1 Tax=Nitrosomonas sp. TaxID=42353 RepID=UPI0025F68DB2|nr:hypothetical protein [Nitrosomonas sp.]